MNRRTLFFGAIVAASILLVLCVYYLVPGVYHPLTFSGSPTEAHLKQAVALAALCLVAALINRLRSVSAR